MTSSPQNLIMLTHGPLQTQFDEDDVTDVLAWDWWRASSENLRKVSAGQGEKKRGGVGGGRTGKKEGRVGWVGDDVIEKIKN